MKKNIWLSLGIAGMLIGASVVETQNAHAEVGVSIRIGEKHHHHHHEYHHYRHHHHRHHHQRNSGLKIKIGMNQLQITSNPEDVMT